MKEKKEKQKIAIITDTTCDISDELLKEYSIYIGTVAYRV